MVKMQETKTMQQITAALIVIAIIVSGLSYINGQNINSNIATLTGTTEALESRVEDSSDIIGDLAEVVGVLGTSMGEIGESVGEYGEEIAAILEKIEALEEIEEKSARYILWEEWSRTIYAGVILNRAFHPDIQIGRSYLDRAITFNRAAKLVFQDQYDMGKWYPYIAESWEFKQNLEGEWYIEWKIKPGLKFQDGADVDAAAVKYCYERSYYELPYREMNREPYHIWSSENTWKRLEVQDKYTLLQFTPDNAQTFEPQLLALYNSLQHGFIFSPASTEKYAKENDPIESAVNQVGYGPFTLVEYIPGERIVLEAWDDMMVRPPGTGPSRSEGIDRVVIKIYADSTTMSMALQKGDIDVTVGGLLKSDVISLLDNPDITVMVAEGVGTSDCLAMNMRPEFAPLNDIRVRTAIAYATFPEEIIEKALAGYATYAQSAVHENFPYYKPVFEPFRQGTEEERIAKAKQLLTDAGYPDGFSTDLWATGGAGGEDAKVATIIQAQLKKIGIDINIKLVEVGVFRDMSRAGNVPMYVNGWEPDYCDPSTDLGHVLSAVNWQKMNGIVGFNVTNPELNAYVDELLMRGRDIYDPAGETAERRAIYEELQDIIVDEMLGVWLYHNDNLDAKRTWLKGYDIYATKTYTRPFWDGYKDIPDDWETTTPPV